MTDDTPRWLYRFENYKRAFALLREAMEAEQELSQLEKEGSVQRFEYAFELAWKTMKDFLEAEGVRLPTITPAAVIRAAFEAKLIRDGQSWMEALDARNKIPQSYDFSTFEHVIHNIAQHYLPAMEELYIFFREQQEMPDSL